MEFEIVKSLAPSEAFPRISEGAFLYSCGKLVFMISRFTGDSDDASTSDIVRMESDDDGATWSEPETVLTARGNYNTGNIMSVSLMTMQNGDLGCFYIVKQTPTVNRIMLSRSKDGGKTFYSHTECTLSERAGYYVLNNDRAERLSSGRILLPLAYHRGGYGGAAGGVYFEGRAFVCFLISDDDGCTWHESADIVFPPFTRTCSGLQEPGCVELDNGVLMGYARTDKMVQYEFFSYDGGEHWTVAEPSCFSSPCSPMKIKRRPGTKELYAIWNPIPCYNGRDVGWGWDRSPISVAVSRDNAVNWTAPDKIEGEPHHGYCYPSIYFTHDGCLITSYCAGGDGDPSILARTNITKIKLDREDKI